MDNRIRSLRNRLRNNRINNMRLKARRTGRRFIRYCLSNLKGTVFKIVKFLFLNPIGRAVLAALILLTYIGNFPTPVINAEEYVSSNLAEYRALNKAMDKESDRFFNDYHAAVSSSMLSPILYTFWDSRHFFWSPFLLTIFQNYAIIYTERKERREKKDECLNDMRRP